MMTAQTSRKPSDIVPPFTLETAPAEVLAAEIAWNSRYPNAFALLIRSIPNGETAANSSTVAKL